MTVTVHHTAVVDPGAELGVDVVVGPYAIVGPAVTVGESAEIAAHAIVERNTDLGRACRVGYGAVVGSAPQDVTYAGEPTRVVIGDGTVIREYATVNRGTTASGVTRVGARCFIMAYVHIAHDCVIGDDTVIANAVQLAGHVEVGHHAWLGGQTPVHQFVRIGEYAFVGGGSRVPQDIPPFTRAAGHPLGLYGINVLGLRRAGFSRDERLQLQRAYRLLFNSRLARADAVARLRADAALTPAARRLVDFVAGSDRGILGR